MTTSRIFYSPVRLHKQEYALRWADGARAGEEDAVLQNLRKLLE